MKRRNRNSDIQGRVAFDDRGNSFWEWRVEDGFSTEVDTSRIRQLQESSARMLSLADPVDPAPTTTHERPYFERERKPDDAPPRRRSLDDMRRLSEEIKRKREAEKKGR